MRSLGENSFKSDRIDFSKLEVGLSTDYFNGVIIALEVVSVIYPKFFRA